MIEEIFYRIFGGYELIDIMSYGWFMLIGYIIYALIETTGRNKKSKDTPHNWNWRFWVKDNWRRYLLTILSTYVLFRFYTEFTGTGFNDFDALMMGLLGDGIAATAKQRIKGISGDRKKMMNDIEKKDKRVI